MGLLRAASLAAALALAGLGLAPAAWAKQRPGPPIRYANPGAVIAAEAGFRRLAQEKGLKPAALETAAPQARIFVPEPVLVMDWAKAGTPPAQPQEWQPHAVWSSCDGSFAVAQGSWQQGDQAGRFLTLWQRQEDASYKWLLRLQHHLAAPLAQPEMIAAKVAECPPRTDREEAPPAPAMERKGKRKAEPAPPPIDPRAGKSDDGTLEWDSGTDPQGAPYFTFRIRTGGQMQPVLPN